MKVRSSDATSSIQVRLPLFTNISPLAFDDSASLQERTAEDLYIVNEQAVSTPVDSLMILRYAKGPGFGFEGI